MTFTGYGMEYVPTYAVASSSTMGFGDELVAKGSTVG